MNDREIGEQLGIVMQTVQRWRTWRGLPSHNPSKRNLSASQHSTRRMMHELGQNDVAIAREQNVTRSAVEKWRRRQQLDARSRRGQSRRVAEATLERVKRAIGRVLPPDLADDAVSDLYLAALEGRITLDRIETEARTFGNRVIANYANKWGARSLDEEIGDSDGFTLLDTIADDSASSWLEEMGATVW